MEAVLLWFVERLKLNGFEFVLTLALIFLAWNQRKITARLDTADRQIVNHTVDVAESLAWEIFEVSKAAKTPPRDTRFPASPISDKINKLKGLQNSFAVHSLDSGERAPASTPKNFPKQREIESN